MKVIKNMLYVLYYWVGDESLIVEFWYVSRVVLEVCFILIVVVDKVMRCINGGCENLVLFYIVLCYKIFFIFNMILD